MRKLLLLNLMLWASVISAQENLTYQKPSKEILDLVDVSPAPLVLIDDKAKYVVLRGRDSYQSIATLSEPELRLAGLRINPKTNISSRQRYYNNLSVKKTLDQKVTQVSGLPANPRLSNFRWNKAQTQIAFTHTTLSGVELWVLDVAKAKAKKLTEAKLNANMGTVYTWFDNGEALLAKFLPNTRKALIDTKVAVPTGPTISVSNGEKAQNRTYQDLLKNKDDEANFEKLATSELKKVSLDGTIMPWASQAMYRNFSFSPDGKFVKVSAIQRPFSYIVPYYRFPLETAIYNTNGKKQLVFDKTPLIEVLPKGFMSTRVGKRSIAWRADKPATLYWAEALDQGDPAIKVPYRDELFEVNAPFTAKPRSLIKLKQRYRSLTWATDQMALVRDYWWNTRNTKLYKFNPSDNKAKVVTLQDRNYQDRYNDPGIFVTTKNTYGRSVLGLEDGKAFLIGDGYTAKGQFPFIDQYDIEKQESTRIYQSNYKDKLEVIYDAVSLKDKSFLVRIESASDYPNFYLRDLDNKTAIQRITYFDNPFKSIQGVHKEVVKYKRYDGVDLSGTLYLPVGYDKKKKEKVPMILWAYPREYKDKKSAGQSTANPNKFTFPYYGSMIYWVTKGYAVLDGAAFPIVGEGDEEPNDTFIKQLVGNAKAAIDAIDNMGYINREKVAVGGHSYGAFMTANLLSHSELFAAGIARSGAYNRTLTPFGFQSEERSYWDAPHIYNTMSPFMNAPKMKHPLLLIHGAADNNSGTYPMQSERYFNALKGLGATARLVILPKESHGYRAKESILHMLWEQDQWLEKYVKAKK